MKQIVDNITTTFTDHHSGEVVSEVKEVTRRFETTPDFVMLFTDSIGSFAGLTKAESQVLFGLLGETKRDNELILNKTIKDRVAIKAEVGANTMGVVLNKLVTKGMLVKGTERGTYYLNPQIFGKGNWRDIKRLRMMLEIDVENGKMTKAYEVEEYVSISEVE